MKINVTQYLDRSAELFADKIAVKDGKSQLTFGQLRSNALTIGSRLVELGIKNAPIAVYMPKSCEMVECFAAISYSGNFYVPLDTKSPNQRVENVLNVLEARVVLTTSQYKDQLAAFCSCPMWVVEEVLETGAIDRAAIDNVLRTIIDTDPVYSIFTSGSTGTPKGVVISHRGVIDYIDWAIETFSIDHRAIIGNQAPFYFDNSTLDLYLMFAAGATLVIVPDEYYAFPVKLIDYLNQEQVNFVFWVPFVLINVANFKLLEQKTLPHMQKVLFAGEVMPNKHLNYWRKHLPNCLYANLYGPTEITVDCTYYIVDRPFTDDEPLPIGVPCKNSGILILNERNEACGVGEQGELCVRGTSLAMGYYNDPEKTAKAFVQNPLNRHYPEVIYRTGDVAYWNDRGEVMYVGRKDSQIKHNGYRIELGEIENGILGTGLIETVCVVYDNTNKEIVMFYVSGHEVNLAELRKAMLQFVPKYMVPTKYHRLDSMPLSANGKIDRLKLNKQING